MKQQIVNLFIEEGILVKFVSDPEKASTHIRLIKGKVVKTDLRRRDSIEYLLENGISRKSKGFEYLLEAIDIVAEKNKKRESYSFAKDVYPAVALKFGVTETSVSKAVANTIVRSKVKDIGPTVFVKSYFY